MNSVSQGTVPPQPPRPVRAPQHRPFRVIDRQGRVRRFATLDAAASIAQQVADQSARPCDVKDTSRGVYHTIRPVQHRCPNDRCRQPLTPEQYDAAQPTHRCLHCGPVREGS